MGPADFDDVLEGFLFGPECLVEGFHGREQFLFDEQDADHMQACREGIVRALGMIDVVIGMDVQVLALGLQNLLGPVSDDFVDVHVELRATAGHPYGQGEIAIELAGQDVIAGLDNGIGPVAVDDAQFLVGQGSGFFQVSKDGDHFGRNLFRADLKILEAALCLGTPEFVSRDFDFSHRISFYTVFHDEPPIRLYKT